MKQDFAGESAKLEALMEQLEPLMEEGQKVLVFSQFVEMLELLKKSIAARGWPTYFLAGETENRGELVQQFQAHEGAATFLISLKAGGFGLTWTRRPPPSRWPRRAWPWRTMRPTAMRR